jgi:hypothetical protein
MKTPDILNSKISKIRIELPHYSFSHSSAGDSPHHFIGRERTLEKLKKIIEDSPNEPGVYLIAGHRGVGKTNLISEVIKDTSLKANSKFTENLKYLLLLLVFVAVIQFCLQKFTQFANEIQAISLILFALSFIALCCCNSYRRKFPKRAYWKNFKNGTVSALKELSYLVNPHIPVGKMQYLLKIISIISFTQIVSIKNSDITPIITFFGYLAIVFLCKCMRFFRNKSRKYKKKNPLDSILNPIKNYIKNRSRLYLRINFGHKLKDEKDILRLIARTLSTEYHKYRRSFWRILPWRIVALCFLILFAHLFSDIVKKQKFYETTKGIVNLQRFEEVIKDTVGLKNVFSTIDTVYIKAKTATDTEIKTKVGTKIGTKVGVFLFALDTLVYDISQKNKIGKFFYSLGYLFWLSFFSMYLFCVLLFRCKFITHFFVTYRIIMRRLKKLNNDIVHSTERENSIGIAGYNSGIIGPGLLAKTKKSRNVADAKEIEKELQEILNDMQRIPAIMCRPNLVIVFDELDKVEPGDADLEKETLQTKASLFSINATREKQTEILKILSNMKYFLSSARSKFIFIAGREMYDIHLADVSERNNYIGSIFNVVIYVPSFLTDHPSGKKLLPQESSIASLPEEFVCRRLIPHEYPVESYDLKNYRIYLEKKIFKDTQQEEIQKIIAVLQQFIIYLAHVSKGAPKKMMQLFESFVEIHLEKDKNKSTLFVQRYHNSRHFLSFNYYKQYTLGIVAYLITPIFYRLAESNIKEHSDKLLVSSLRFVDFVFKFHKHSFSWKHLDMSPEMLEVNRAPELKSVAVDLLNYLSQVHINKSNFSLSDYKFDGLIANEIFAMAKTDDVFSALFSFSLDEMSPLKNHYKNLLKETEKEYRNEKTPIPDKYIEAISSLQAVLGDLYYYDDELEEAETYYKNSVQAFRENENNENNKITLEQLYVYVRNMLRLGIIYEKRKQYDFAYLTYGEICKRIIGSRNTTILLFNTYDNSFDKITYDGLKMLYLPFIAKLQILEQSHIGGISPNHLRQLEAEFNSLKFNIDLEAAKLLEAEFYSRVADILYYKNSDLKSCDYYHKALSILLGKTELNKPEDKNTVIELLYASVEKINSNYNAKFCTIMARILSDWGNVFFSCDTKNKKDGCYICDTEDCKTNRLVVALKKYITESKKENGDTLLKELKKRNSLTKMEIAFAMYSISLQAYRKASLYKRASYQIYKMLCLFKRYGICKSDYIDKLSEKAIHYLWRANENLNVFELNKRKKDFDKAPIEKIIPLHNLLVDSEITRIRILVKELELKSDLTPKKLNEYYGLRITSPYRINYSIVGRIYRLRLKSKVNYEAYKQLLKPLRIQIEKDFILKKEDYNKLKISVSIEDVKKIFGEEFDIKEILENLIADSIYCLIDIAQLLETMDETYLFPHSFLGSIHEHLSFWIRQYEKYETYKEKDSKIDKYLKKYLDEEWRELLSGYRENQKALSHYYKSLEMHNEGRAYHNMIDTMCYVRDDFNDRSDHFNIAEERHLIVNGDIEKKINDLKDIYKNSELYKVKNYFAPLNQPPPTEDHHENKTL